MSKKPNEERHKVLTREWPKSPTPKRPDWLKEETAESKSAKAMVPQKPREEAHNKATQDNGNGFLKSFLLLFKQLDATRKKKGVDDKKDWVGGTANGAKGAHSVAKNTGSIWVGGNATDTNTGAHTDGKPPSQAQAHDTGLVFVAKDADNVNTGAQASNGASSHAENTGYIGVHGSAKNLNAGATSHLDDKHQRNAK